jgi:hypothetical protein
MPRRGAPPAPHRGRRRGPRSPADRVPTVPERLHHRSVAGMADEQGRALQNGGVRHGPFHLRIGRHRPELDRVVVGPEGHDDSQPARRQSVERGPRQRHVVLELRADRDQRPRVPWLREIWWNLARWFPDTQRPDVVVSLGQPVEGEVEHGIRRVQHEIGFTEQRGVAGDQRDSARAEVCLEGSRRMRADVEGAVHDGPRTTGVGGVQCLQAEQRRDDRGGVRFENDRPDGIRDLTRPFGHRLSEQRPRRGKVAAGRGHGLPDRPHEARSEVELGRENGDRDIHSSKRTIDRGVSNEGHVVATPAEPQGCSDQWLEVAPGARGRHDQESSRGPAHIRSPGGMAASVLRASRARSADCPFPIM